jgi:hypothetical protein
MTKTIVPDMSIALTAPLTARDGAGVRSAWAGIF